MNEDLEQWKARLDREAQTKALKQQAEAAEKQTLLMERQAREQKKQQKRARQSENRENGKGNFHGLYCLLIGWWLAMFLICCIVPLFFSGGRKLIKKAFGIW